MATITTIAAGDQITDSRSVLNNNFAALNSDKIETSYLDTDTTMAANSDVKIPTQKAVKAYIDTGGSAAFISALVPVGLILPYGGSSAPSNYFLCDGTAKNRTTYAALFAIVGTTFGVGDGSTTFNLPDLRGRMPMGAGTGTKVATFASRASNVITVTGLSDAANNEFQTGQAVTYHTSNTVITGLTNDTVYYVIRTGNLTFSLATTLANAQNATAIALSSDGSGTQTFTLTLTARTAGHSGGEENHAMSITELLSHTHLINNTPITSPDENNVSPSGATAWATSTQNTTQSAGGNAAMNNIAPFQTVNYIIKYA